MKTLYPYQKDAHRAVLRTLKTLPAALIVMATGLGKTVVAAALVRWWAWNRKTPILFLVHLWDAIEQAENEFRDALGKKARFQRLNEHGTVDPSAQVVFCTFQTMRNRMGRIPRNAFGLVIVDEGHRSKASTFEPVVKHFRPEFYLAMTATPDRMDRRDIRDLFGDPVYDYPLARALADRTLADVEYRVLTDTVSAQALKRMMKRLNEGDRKVTKAMIDRHVFLAERLEETVRRITDAQKTRRKTVIFCHSRKHARAVVRYFPGARLYVSGIPANELRENLPAFRNGEVKTLIAVDKLNEAVDVPDADHLVFLRGTDSSRIWLQQLGRGLRKIKGKHDVLVQDFVGNCDRLYDVAALTREAKGYLRSTDDNPEIRETGMTFNFSVQARDIFSLLQRLKREFYPTIEEAALMTRKLGIKGQVEYYRSDYLKDSRLPANPMDYYGVKAWNRIGRWPGFLRGKPEAYATIEQAAKAARKLGIKKVFEYSLRYKEDLRLPSNPVERYGVKAWNRIGRWPGFLRGKPEAYATIGQAAKAARKLGCRNATEYRSCYKDNRRLPSTPDRFYGTEAWNRIGRWPGFLGTNKMRKKRRK